MFTHKEKTFNGIWPMTKENTWYGYQINDQLYIWWKTKKTAIKYMPDKMGWILRGTMIGDQMYINHRYAKMGGF